MSARPPTLIKVIDSFSKFPGIGMKTAYRLGLYVLKLSRYSHVLIRFPGVKKIVEKIVEEFPDNAFNRTVWKITESLLNIRVHAGVPLSFFVKYFLYHRNKQVR